MNISFAGLASDVIDFQSTYDLNKVYSYVAYDGDTSGDGDNLVTFDITTGAVTTVAPLGDYAFYTGTFVNGILTAIDNGTKDVYFITGTGSAYKAGTLSGDLTPDVTVTGAAYDAGTQQAYIMGFSSSQSANVLFTVDTDFNTTLIGTVATAGVVIAMDIDNNGNLYALDITDDQLYSIDPATGSATAIGPTGLDLSYAQDMAADPTTGDLYGTLYEVGGSTGGLYSIDKVTGMATAIGTHGPDEYTICAIKGTTVSISENTIEGLRVYPNPTNGNLLINAKENIVNIKVMNLAGQEVMSVPNDGLNAQLDLSNLPSGAYILKIATDQTVATYQIVKK